MRDREQHLRRLAQAAERQEEEQQARMHVQRGQSQARLDEKLRAKRRLKRGMTSGGARHYNRAISVYAESVWIVIFFCLTMISSPGTFTEHHAEGRRRAQTQNITPAAAIMSFLTHHESSR